MSDRRMPNRGGRPARRIALPSAERRKTPNDREFAFDAQLIYRLASMMAVADTRLMQDVSYCPTVTGDN